MSSSHDEKKLADDDAAAEPNEAKFLLVTPNPLPMVPHLRHTLPLDAHSVDEGRRRGYCRDVVGVSTADVPMLPFPDDRSTGDLASSGANTQARLLVVVSSSRPRVPSLTHTLPLDARSVDEGRHRGYC